MHGFYGLPLNAGSVTLIKCSSKQFPVVAVGSEVAIFRGGEYLSWSLGDVVI